MKRRTKKSTSLPSDPFRNGQPIWGEPDEIELEIIRVVTAIPEQARAENWPTDDRMRITRLISKWRSFGSNRAPVDIMAELEDRIVTDRWTKTIIDQLRQLGKQLGYITEPAVEPLRWMWDLAWLKRDIVYSEPRDNLIGLPLILECALGRRVDLDKLVTARAEHRVMIFYGELEKGLRGNPHPDVLFDRFAMDVRYCGLSQAGDRYLFVCFDRKDREFKFRVFVSGDPIAL